MTPPKPTLVTRQLPQPCQVPRAGLKMYLLLCHLPPIISRPRMMAMVSMKCHTTVVVVDEVERKGSIVAAIEAVAGLGGTVAKAEAVAVEVIEAIVEEMASVAVVDNVVDSGAIVGVVMEPSRQVSTNPALLRRPSPFCASEFRACATIIS